MATYQNRTAVAGDLIDKAPISANNVLDIPAGYFCKCDNNAQGGVLTNYTATVALPTAPAVKLIEQVKILDQNGNVQFLTFSKQYLVSTLITAATIAEIDAEFKAFASRYLVNAGNALVKKSGSNLIFTITARLPFVAQSVIVDGVAVAFV